jgi:hypothetical protein
VFQSPIFDIVVALPFLYAVLSLVCTAVHEWVASILHLRATTLRQGLLALLDSPDVALSGRFYAHTEVCALTSVSGGHPAYLCPRAFARVLVDVITGTETALVEAGQISAAIRDLPAGRVRTTLLNLLRHVNLDDPEAARAIHQRIENWFNEAMDRTAARYQRFAQVITCTIAFIICIALNADSLRVAQVLWSSPSVRAHLVSEATSTVPHPQHAPSRIEIEDQIGSLLGWSDDLREAHLDLDEWAGWEGLLRWCIPHRLAGWLLTTVAVSFGAPFWFDTLNRVVRLRMTEPKPASAETR